METWVNGNKNSLYFLSFQDTLHWVFINLYYKVILKEEKDSFYYK